MRHNVEGRKLKRTASHRRALLRALTVSLLRHKRIRTTEAKAKEARRFAEAIITRAKNAYLAEQAGSATNIHARRVVARDINDAAILKELFSEIAQKVAGRPGGYTRVVKLGQRIGDGARVAILELVDYNTERDENAVRSRAKRMMSRAERVARSRAKQAELEAKQTPAVAQEEAPAEEAVIETTAAETAPVADAATEEQPTTEAPAAETAADGDQAKG
ncbi:MAG: 50S ribosomal protein L17 [Armatimonadetes bacterium]|nr:50S ribosomal protein L17 [Armatimonadota bacterium]